MVRNCRTQQAHVRDAHMYCTPGAAVYGKELQNTSTCQGRIHVLHTKCNLVYGKELQNTTSTCQGRIHVLHTECSLVYGKELQNTSTCQGRIHVLHTACSRVWYGTAKHNKHMSRTHTCIVHRVQPSVW